MSATSAPRARLVWRLFLAVGGVVAAVLAAVLLLLGAAARRTADASITHALERTTRLVTAQLAGRAQSLTRAAQVFALNPAFRALVLEQRPEDLFDQATEAAQQTGASWVQIVDAEGVRLARSDDPTAPRVPLGGSVLIGAPLQGEEASGVGASGDTALFQAVAVPIVGTTQVAGALMLSQAIDSTFAAEVRDATASEVVFYVVDTVGRPHVAASTLGRDDARLRELLTRVAPTSPEDDGAHRTLALELDGARYVGRAAPLRSAGGDLLGGFVALRSRDAELAPFAALSRGIVVAGLLGLALAFALAYLTAQSIARPVLALARATRRAAGGDYAVEVSVRSRDEVGALADAVRAMIVDLRDKAALVELLRARDGATRGTGLVPARSPSTEPGAAIEPGRTVAGRYYIDAVVGRGGGGIVHRAIDRELGEIVALKVLRPELVAEDPSALPRLKSEIRLARRISHRNVVRTHDLGESGGSWFLTMEYVTGTSLRDLLEQEQRLPVAAALAIGKQLCHALQAAHEQGVIHRDVKPHNMMVQPDGTLKVMDFGVARLARLDSGLTRTGLAVGTPAYMAPEQLLGEPVDARTDLYAVGAVLYECLTGRRAVEADTVPVLIARLLAGEVVSPAVHAPEVPPALADVVLQLLARDPAERVASAAELYDRLVATES